MEKVIFNLSDTEMSLLEIIHKDNVWQNLGREFFVLRIIMFCHSMNMIDNINGRIFYKNLFLFFFTGYHYCSSKSVSGQMETDFWIV